MIFENKNYHIPLIPLSKVILLRGEATETGRRTKFRELRRLRRWNENVNRWPKAKLDGRERHLLPVPMASPINYPA